MEYGVELVIYKSIPAVVWLSYSDSRQMTSGSYTSLFAKQYKLLPANGSDALKLGR